MHNIVTTKMFGQQLNYGHWSTDGLVFYWRGIPAGNAVDESPYGNDGTITGAVWGPDGVVFQHNTNQFIATVSTTLYNGPLMTVIARFKANEAGFGPLHESDTIVQRYHTASFGWKLGIDNNGRAVWLHYLVGQLNDAVTGSVNLVGEWHTIVGVRTATNLFLYVDGLLAGQDTVTSGDLTASQPIEWGRWKAATLEATLDGVISDTSFYDRALSATEIQALYINPDLPMQEELPVWLGQAPVGGTTPKGPLGHPLYGPFAGPIAC